MGTNYTEALAQVGLLPTMTPSLWPEKYPDAPGALLDSVDAVLFSGGADIDPRYYGQDPDPQLGAVDPKRDAFELALYTEARAREIPILGICRGIQLVAVAEGGALHQHLPANPAMMQHQQHAPEGHPHHAVRLEPGTPLAEAFVRQGVQDLSSLAVNTYHHQGLDGVPGTLRAIAWSSDGLVEAVEARDGGFLVAVQWHPEMAFAEHPVHVAPFEMLARALGVDS